MKTPRQKNEATALDRKNRPKYGKAGSNLESAKSKSQEFLEQLNKSIQTQLLGQSEKFAHDHHVGKLTQDNFYAAQKFIRACGKVGGARLRQNQLTDDAGFYLAEIATELCRAIVGLVGQGDVMLARRLTSVAESLQTTIGIYGSKIAVRPKKCRSIEEILENHNAHDLLATLSTLYPSWELILHLPNRREIQFLSEQDLRVLLLSKVKYEYTEQGQPKTEVRSHPISEVIENVFFVREGESARINIFVEYLWQGRLWGLRPGNAGLSQGGTFIEYIWNGLENLPSRENVQAWMKIVMPFLKKVTGGDAMRLEVFRYLLAVRKPVVAGKTLAEDKPEYVWNQVENRIVKAWRVMAKRANKRNLEKTA